MPPRRSVFLCTSPRSGSTLLCGLLRQTGGAGLPESWFRAEDRADYAAEWAVPMEGGAPREPDFTRAAIRAGSGPDGTFGLRIMAPTLRETLARLRSAAGRTADDAALLTAAFGPVTWLWLEREDKTAQAVSRYRAEASGLWHRKADGAPLELFGAAPAPHDYDAARIAAFRAEAEADTGWWRGWFAANAIAPHRISYEALAADPVAATRDLCARAALPVADPALLSPTTARLADETSAHWAARSREG